MTERYLWPRLSATRAVERRAELAGRDPEAARVLAAPDDGDAAPASSGGRPVPPERIAAARDELDRLAVRHGWPDPLAPDDAARFDRAAALGLHREMAIVPADAAHDGVWNFVALVVAPHVATWRRPGGAPLDRGGPGRHVFGRLWWWTEVLGPAVVDPPSGRPLAEPEIQHLVGRAAVVADRAVARAAASALLSVEDDDTGPPRELVAERLAEGILRRQPVVCFEVLTPDELAAEIAGQLELAVRGSGRVAGPGRP